MDQAITGATSAGSAGGGDGASEWGSTHEVGLEAAAVAGVEQAVQPQTAIGCTIQAITVIDLQLPVQYFTQGMRIREHRAKLNTLTIPSLRVKSRLRNTVNQPTIISC